MSCSPYARKTDRRAACRAITLLRRSDGTDANSPRDLPGNDGQSAKKALAIAARRVTKDIERCVVLEEMARVSGGKR